MTPIRKFKKIDNEKKLTLGIVIVIDILTEVNKICNYFYILVIILRFVEIFATND